MLKFGTERGAVKRIKLTVTGNFEVKIDRSLALALFLTHNTR